MVELAPMLNLLSVAEKDQLAVFYQVDIDSSGQVDFGEFVELMHLVGGKYSDKLSGVEQTILDARKVYAIDETNDEDTANDVHSSNVRFVDNAEVNENKMKNRLYEENAVDSLDTVTQWTEKETHKFTGKYTDKFSGLEQTVLDARKVNAIDEKNDKHTASNVHSSEMRYNDNVEVNEDSMNASLEENNHVDSFDTVSQWTENETHK